MVFCLFMLPLILSAQWPTRTTLYRPGDLQSKNYRIPAIVTADDGSLVVATDKRKYNDRDLPEDIDIIINRSTDGGRTWSEPITLAEGTGVGEGFGDCALVRTNEEGGLIAVFVGGVGFWQSRPDNPLCTYLCRSHDNGLTWSEPKDITHFILGPDCVIPEHRSWWSSFFASGAGLRTSSGRIMFAAAVREDSLWQANNYVFYSDDNGETWHCSGRASVGGDEAKLVELSDGRILMSIRAAGHRWYNLSYDGGITWRDTTTIWTDIIAPACNGDILRCSTEDGRTLLLHSLPYGKERSDVSIFISFDEGKTWPLRRTIVPYPSAYSSHCQLPDGTIGLYVEEAKNDGVNYSMVFYNFSVEWLLDGTDSVPGIRVQTPDSTTISADTTVLPMATGYDWITYRGKADIIDTGGTRTCNFYMVNRTDSILYLNIHAYGIEVIRAVFTPDSIFYVNKLTQQYFCDTYAPLNRFLPFTVDFQTIQALFNGQTEKLPQGKRLSYEYSAFEPVDSTSSFFTEFVFKELNRVIEVRGKIKVIRLNMPGFTNIKIPEKFERITL